MSFDDIYQKKSSRNLKGTFKFNREVANVFDNMLERSIPFYAQTQALIIEVFKKKLPSKPLIYDLGCSTGNFIFQVDLKMGAFEACLMGLDDSKAMIEKALKKFKTLMKKTPSGVKNIHFMVADVTDHDFLAADAFVLNYTLQFIEPKIRLAFLKHLYRKLKKAGLLVISEKVVEESKDLTNLLEQLHEDFKRNNHYSSLEIALKRKALEKVLSPQSVENHHQQLRQAGFKKITTLFKSGNFATFLAVK